MQLNATHFTNIPLNITVDASIDAKMNEAARKIGLNVTRVITKHGRASKLGVIALHLCTAKAPGLKQSAVVPISTTFQKETTSLLRLQMDSKYIEDDMWENI